MNDADVAQAGPFSRFAEVDRTLVLLSGASMLLDEAGGATHTLREPLDIARFEGETAIDARLIDGATRDFNLMVRRGAATGDVAIWRDPTRTQLDADVVLLFCAQGELHVATDNAANTTTLVTMDTRCHAKSQGRARCSPLASAISTHRKPERLPTSQTALP